MVRKIVSREVGAGGAHWMDSYTDLVSLLLTFFVFLFAFSNVDSERMNEFLATYAGAPFAISSALDSGFSSFPSIRREEGEPSEPPGEAIAETSETGEYISPEQAQINAKFNEMFDKIETYIAVNGLDGSMSAQKDGGSILIRFHENMLFDSGKADLKPIAADTIVRVRALLYEQQDAYASVHIEGHTDNIPISTFQYRDNWYLSQDRAQVVLHKLIEDDTIPFDLAKFTATGKSEYHPIASNETAEGRALNRRVDIVIERRNLQ